jgi:hypothetical protein
MAESPPAPPPPPRRAVAAAVGLFAAWQLLYLPAANLIDLIPRRLGPPLEPVADGYQARGAFTAVEPVQRAADWAGDALDFWSEVSGQEQGWSLFAPKMPDYSVFPAVEFQFADGTRDDLRSPFEPADKSHPPLRPPLLDNRPFNAEAVLMYPVWFAPPEAVVAGRWPPAGIERLPEAYAALPETVRVWRGVIRAWLAWRLAEYRTGRPDRGPPVAVVLKHRFVPTPEPGDPHGWTAPVVERPYAKWRPAADTIEAYDAILRQFVPVEEKP